MKASKIRRLRKVISKYSLYTVYITTDYHIVQIQIYAENEQYAIIKYMKKRLIIDKQYPESWDSHGCYVETTSRFGEIKVIDERGYIHYFY